MKKFIVLLFMLTMGATLQAQTPTPTPTPLPLFDNVNNPVATAAGYANDLPSQLDQAPTGGSILPSVNAGELFKYVKWILSFTVLQELLGMTLAPIAQTISVYLVMSLIITAIYFLLFAFVLVFRFAAWAFNLILQILQVVAALVGDVVKFLAMFLGL